MNIEGKDIPTANEHLIIDLVTYGKRSELSDVPDSAINPAPAVISGKNVTIVINSVLSLINSSIGAYGDGYLTVWADIFQEDGGYRKRLLISALDLTPADSGDHSVKKLLENIPPGRYRASFDFTSYWKSEGRFRYSTYASIEVDGEQKWSHQLVATEGQNNPIYQSAVVKFIVTI